MTVDEVPPQEYKSQWEYLEECDGDVGALGRLPQHHAPVGIPDPRLPAMQLEGEERREEGQAGTQIY